MRAHSCSATGLAGRWWFRRSRMGGGIPEATMSQFPPITPGPMVLRPHRATMILVLGILSLILSCVGLVLGILAWVMGNADLREMDAGRMDPSGRGMTQAGKICGMVSVLLHVLGLVIVILWLVLAGGIAAAGA